VWGKEEISEIRSDRTEREPKVFSLSITNLRGCRWAHLIGSLAFCFLKKSKPKLGKNMNNQLEPVSLPLHTFLGKTVSPL